jgi:hypothetical protein
MLKSIISKKEKLENLNKKFGELDYYYPCFIDNKFALFTETELNNAINRGQKNKEEYLPRIEKNLKKIKIKRIKK